MPNQSSGWSLVQILKLKFCQDFEAGTCQDFEADVGSRFWKVLNCWKCQSCYMDLSKFIHGFLWLLHRFVKVVQCLGSVVPLTMFLLCLKLDLYVFMLPLCLYLSCYFFLKPLSSALECEITDEGHSLIFCICVPMQLYS